MNFNLRKVDRRAFLRESAAASAAFAAALEVSERKRLWGRNSAKR